MDLHSCIALGDLKESLKGFFNDVKSGDTPSKASFDYTVQMQSIKSQIIEELGDLGFYKRDDGRIVISAPEIIIGNVDRTGVMYPNVSSVVTIRASNVSLQCPAMCNSEDSYSGGILSMVAPTIMQDAVNPGVEGEQSVVCGESKIVSRAKSIALSAQNTGDCFLLVPGVEEGISLSSQQGISLKSSQPRDLVKVVEELEKSVDSQIKGLTQSIEDASKTFDDSLKELENLQENTNELLGEDDFETSGSISSIDENIEAFASRAAILKDEISSCEKMVRRLAELKRIDKSFKEGSVKTTCSAFPTGADVSSNGIVSVLSDKIDLNAVNGDGLETETSFVSISAKNVKIATTCNGEETVKGSSIALHAETISADTSVEKEDGSFANVGAFSVNSKIMSFVAQDVSKEGEVTPTEGSKIDLSAQDITAGALEYKEGKTAGTFKVNTKEIVLRAVDQDLSDAENIKDKELSAEGKIELFAKNLQIGNIGEDEEKLKTEKITIVGKEVLVDLKKAEDKFDLNQEDAPILDITGSKTTIKSKEGFGIEEGDVTIKTNVTIEGKTEFKDEAKGTKVVAQNVEASAGVKTPKVDK